MGTLKYIGDLLKKQKYRYALGIIFLLCVDILQLIIPWILGETTNSLEAGLLKRQDLAHFAISLALTAAGIALFRFLFRYTLYGAARSIELSFRNRLYAHLQRLSVNWFNTHKTGDLMAHATNDMNNVTMATGQGIIFAVDCLLVPIAALIMMWLTAGFSLTAASFAPLLLLSLVTFFFMKIMHNSVQKQQEAFSYLTETARENFSGIRVIKSFVQEGHEIEHFKGANETNRRANLKVIRLMSMMFPSVMLVSSLSFVIALWYGGALVIKGAMPLGDFVKFNSYLGMLIWPITTLGWVVNIFQRGSVSLKRINSLMDEKPEIVDTSGDGASLVDNDIVFKNVTFTYPGNSAPTLEDISFTIEKGKTLAIIGRTGSGKSTLINLIPRLLSAPPESIYIGGRDINSLPLSQLRRNIGCVPQETFLFSDTIRSNIDFYRGYHMSEIEKASQIARLYDNIMEFPKGFQTIVGERGVTLSGGQKQRTAIARAVLGLPSILILDDCLSAVDAKTEESILQDLKALMKQRTSIIVSHRISAVKDADEIIVLDEGKIIQRGTHNSLIDSDGYYQDLYTKQLLADEIEEAE